MNLDFGLTPGAKAVCAEAPRAAQAVERRLRVAEGKAEAANASGVARAMMGAAALLLPATFFAPLWHYNFTVPLYPEYPQGLPMTIYIGHLEGRIDLINELNHYIGMRKIDAGDFVALSVMPWLIAVLCAGALAAVIWGRERLWPFVAWVGAFAVSGFVLLGDFYWWLYTYSHDLNPHAAIRMPPFTPHLLGSYTLLDTFHVLSWPGLGGIAMTAAFAFGCAAFAAQLLGRRAVAGPSRRRAFAPGRAPAVPALPSWR